MTGFADQFDFTLKAKKAPHHPHGLARSFAAFSDLPARFGIVACFVTPASFNQIDTAFGAGIHQHPDGHAHHAVHDITASDEQFILIGVIIVKHLVAHIIIVAFHSRHHARRWPVIKQTRCAQFFHTRQIAR